MIKVEVTADHISRGERGACDRCAIAISLREMYPTSDVEVHTDVIKITDLSGTVQVTKRWATPDEVADWIEAFDEGREASPMSFDLPDQPTSTSQPLPQE